MKGSRLTLKVARGSFGCQSIDRIALAVASTKNGGEGGVRLQLVGLAVRQKV